MNISTIAQFAALLLSLRQFDKMSPMVVEGEAGKYSPAFSDPNSSVDTRWYTIRPELAVKAGEVAFRYNAGMVSNDAELFLTYTVEPGLGYGAKLDFDDVQTGVTGNPFSTCKHKDDYEITARELLARNGFSRSPVLDMFTASYFWNKTLELRQLLTTTYTAFPNLASATADECRNISCEYNAFFDSFYQKLDSLGFGKLNALPLFTENDIRIYIPALKKAYTEYVKGFIPRLNYYVNPPVTT